MTGSSRVCPTLHMSPIYGAAALVGPLSHRLKGCWMPLRGLIYMTGFFGVEYVSGSFLKKYDCCPWDYSKAPLQIGGVIRLDYAPLWFATGRPDEKEKRSAPETGLPGTRQLCQNANASARPEYVNLYVTFLFPDPYHYKQSVQNDF